MSAMLVMGSGREARCPLIHSRLDWAKVDLERGYITVDASTAKTNSRRLVPITPNLKAWLDLAVGHHGEGGKKPHGKVLELANVFNALKRLVTATRPAAGPDEVLVDGHRLPAPAEEWKHNALRHSFCSYRLADVKSAAQVALEAGNSP
jgi:integrase